jgi:hypothetical protein
LYKARLVNAVYLARRIRLNAELPPTGIGLIELDSVIPA